MRKYSRFSIYFSIRIPAHPFKSQLRAFSKKDKNIPYQLQLIQHSFGFLSVTHLFGKWQLSSPTKSCLLFFFSGKRECSAGSRRLHRIRSMIFVFLYSLCHLSTSLSFNSALHFVFGTASRDTTQHDAPSFLAWRSWFLFLQKASSRLCHPPAYCADGDTNAIEWDRVEQGRATIWLGASCSFGQLFVGFSFRQVQTLLSSMFVGRHIHIFPCRNRHRTHSLAKIIENGLDSSDMVICSGPLCQLCSLVSITAVPLLTHSARSHTSRHGRPPRTGHQRGGSC